MMAAIACFKMTLGVIVIKQAFAKQLFTQTDVMLSAITKRVYMTNLNVNNCLLMTVSQTVPTNGEMMFVTLTVTKYSVGMMEMTVTMLAM